MYETTSNESCVEIARLLHAHGVRRVVVSPGSRNAPLSVAINRLGVFNVEVVIDERTAGFVALGMALIASEPVAVMCTSGTALLNLAPAVEEAYYRHVPLIVISADRPAEWIDQDDSQTLRQYKALDNIVKGSYNLPAFTSTPNLRWLVNRTVNDCIATAVADACGPVHLNVQIDEPLDRMSCPETENVRAINVLRAHSDLPVNIAEPIAKSLSEGGKILIIAGFGQPSSRINSLLGRLASLNNIAVMTEAQSNVHLPSGANVVPAVDATLSAMTDEMLEEMMPDIVITFGGSLLSRFVKQWLRGGAARGIVRHWHVGVSDHAVDCFRCLEMRVDMPAEVFFHGLVRVASALSVPTSDYGQRWRVYAAEAALAKYNFCDKVGWTDLKAMELVMASIPSAYNLQLSNGTAVRYAQLFNNGHIHRIDCNRGVSGIDGCTSTAIGAAKAYSGPTVLVTGDMSAQYDMGALAVPDIPADFRIVVLNNGGGGIFRFIRSTSGLAELERYFVGDVRLPLASLAEAFGFGYCEVSSAEDFEAVADKFFNSKSSRPAIMNIITPGQESADTLREYFSVKIKDTQS